MHIILGFKPISTHCQVSKHVINAKDSHLALVDVAIKGFIWKPPLARTQPVELPVFIDPQPLAEEVISLDNEIETRYEGTKEET